MISVSNSLTKDHANVMQHLGGFSWRYLDLVDEDGDGLVLIASFGLPFLPHTRRPEPPGSRPALNLAVYRDGAPTFYLLQELTPDRAEASESVWTFGACTLRFDDTSPEPRVSVTLDAPVPGSRERLRGSIEVVGSRCRIPSELPRGGAHTWRPIVAGGAGRAELSWGAGGVTVAGRAYVDGNASAVPLHELGIRDWSWGRFGLGERELIYYQVRPEDPGAPVVCHVLEVFPDGAMRIVRAPTLGWMKPRRSLYGLSHHRELHLVADALNVDVVFTSLVDDGPFYQRSLVSATCRQTSATGRGFAELVAPPRVDIPWQRPFVRMRRHAVGGDNSMWLPLFNGDRRDRVRRLFSHWRMGGAPT